MARILDYFLYLYTLFKPHFEHITKIARCWFRTNETSYDRLSALTTIKNASITYKHTLEVDPILL